MPESKQELEVNLKANPEFTKAMWGFGSSGGSETAVGLLFVGIGLWFAGWALGLGVKEGLTALGNSLKDGMEISARIESKR